MILEFFGGVDTIRRTVWFNTGHEHPEIGCHRLLLRSVLDRMSGWR